MVARQLTAATHFPGQFSCKASGHVRAMLAPTRVFASLSPKYSCPPHGSLPHRLRAEPPRRGGQERAAPRAEFSPFVGNVIRRGAFYMRPRKFILPQVGTGGYGIRPYVFEAAEHSASTSKSAGRAASPVCGIRNVGAVVCAGGVAGGVSSAGVCALTGAGIVLACSGVNRPLSSSCGTKGESKGKGSEFFHG